MRLRAILPLNESLSLLDLVCFIRKHSGLTSRRDEAIRCLTNHLLHQANRWATLRENLSTYDNEQVALDSVHVLLTRYILDVSVPFAKDTAILCLLKKIVERRKISEIRRLRSQDVKMHTKVEIHSNDHLTELADPAALCEHYDEFRYHINRLTSDVQCRVFELRYKGYTVKEIASELDLSLNQVRSVRHEIRRLFSTNHQPPTTNHQPPTTNVRIKNTKILRLRRYETSLLRSIW